MEIREKLTVQDSSFNFKRASKEEGDNFVEVEKTDQMERRLQLSKTVDANDDVCPLDNLIAADYEEKIKAIMTDDAGAGPYHL